MYFIVAYFSQEIVIEDIPSDMEALVAEKRRELIEIVSEVDDQLAEAFLEDVPITSTDLEVHWTVSPFVCFFPLASAKVVRG